MLSTMEDDDRSSSADSFSLIEDHQNKADDFDADGKEKAQLEPPSKSTMKQPQLVEVAKVGFNGFLLRIFTEAHSTGKDRQCFYFEPVASLDPSSIVSESNELLKQDLVRFKVKMWDADIRAEVIERIRSLPCLKHEDIHKEDVQVMPYEEVQLTVEPGSLISSIKLKSKPIRYSRLSESLSFQFECASPAVAVELAENFKKNPELFLEQWELALECRGLALGTWAKSLDMTSSKGVVKSPSWIFNVSTVPVGVAEGDVIIRESAMGSLLPRLSGYDKTIEELKTMMLFRNQETCTQIQGHDKEISDLKSMIQSGKTNGACTKIHQDLQDQIRALSNQKSSTCVPVFSVENCINPGAAEGESFGFSTSVIDTPMEHGVFDLPSGIFTVKTAGTYELNFNGHVTFASGSSTNRFDLKVNGERVAVYYNQIVSTTAYQPAGISALLQLDAGDEVGVFAIRGKLYNSALLKIRFYGILLNEDPSADE